MASNSCYLLKRSSNLRKMTTPSKIRKQEEPQECVVPFKRIALGILNVDQDTFSKQEIDQRGKHIQREVQLSYVNSCLEQENTGQIDNSDTRNVSVSKLSSWEWNVLHFLTLYISF